jgi:NAD(P)-dependent dehydrogenase (short-subunit alcohol dehydrogenase family)
MKADPTPPVAIVTGAARRIGAAIAHRLAAEGFAVVLHTSPASEAEGHAEADRIRASGGRAVVAAHDLADLDAASSLFDAAEGAFGGVRLLVSNASLFERDRAEDFSPDLLEHHIAINLRAPLLLAQELRKRLADDGDAAIINIVDQRVLRPNPAYFTYSISKSALWSATVTLAQAFAPKIRVNAIGPGPVLPNVHEGARGFAEEAAALPLKHAASIEDICDAVIYLAMARSVTGQFIAVDGGQHLAWETPDVLALNPRSAGGGS